MAPQTETETLSIADVAKRWGVSERTVRRLIHELKLRAIWVGRQLRIQRAEVLRYENANTFHR